MEYWTFWYNLILEDGSILKGDRIVVPETLKHSVFKILYTCHQEKKKCIICSKYQPLQPKLQLMQPDLPTRPWATIGMDICEQDQYEYLLVVDYYSRFPVFITLPDTTVCEQFTQVLTKYGSSTTIMSDRRSQYMSERFKRKFHDSNIMLKTSSPYHHQTNGVVERTIGTIKALLKKAQQKKKCPYTALWMYRTTPKNNDMPSSYELLFSRKPRTMLPTARGRLQSCLSGKETFPKNEQNQAKQKQNYAGIPAREKKYWTS